MAGLPEAALRALQRGVPADKVLMPNVELSPRERQFVQRMAEGAGKREAFIEAFEPGGTSRSVSTAAWKVAKRPEVQQALSQQQAVERLRYSQNPLQIRSFVVDSLQHEARTAQRPADRLRALELLGRLADVGAFETRSVIEHRTASDTKARLAEKLRRLTIDVEVTPTGEGEGQTGRVSGGPTRSTNPHQQSEEIDGTPYESPNIPPRGGIIEEEAPYEGEVGSHEGEGVKKKKKERPIWEDPKRWYAETMGEVPKIEWVPREDARDEVQKRLKDDEGGG